MTTAQASKSSAEYPWWASLKHGGLLIAPGHLTSMMPSMASQLSPYLELRLRSAVSRMQQDPKDQSELIDVVLEKVVGLGRIGDSGTGTWLKGSAIDTSFSHAAVSGETIRPRRLWRGNFDAVLPVFVEKATDVARLGIGKGRRPVARVIEWLRRAGLQVALITNGYQWRIVYAGLDHDAFAEADTSLWFEEGQAAPQVDALRILLAPDALQAKEAGGKSPLLLAIEATRRGQSELSADLGERVRQAVERLVHEVISKKPLPSDIDNRSLYIAATRSVMRLVVILFAEAKEGLLPRDNAVYYSSYSLEGLRVSLEAIGYGSGKDRLTQRYGSWPRILALFKLLHGGSHHESLPIPAYGGGLFEPGDPQSDDPVSKALALFEDTQRSPDDSVVLEILKFLTKAHAKIRQGKSSKRILAPVDFATLSSEYIGILYEGLLDFELHQVKEGDPVIFLKLGDQPALPLSRLEGMSDKQITKLVETFKKSNAKLVTEDAGDEDEEDAADEEAIEEEPQDVAEESQENEAQVDEVEGDADSIEMDREAERKRAEQWAQKAVALGKLVRKSRSKKPEAQAAYDSQVESAARALIQRLLLPRQWFLVRYGGTRKGSGTFYTKPGLAVPTARRTLLPLVSTPPIVNGETDEDAKPSDWTPKSPEAILALKVCDPACGSGSFLVAALRYLTEQLIRSLHHHGRIAANGDQTLVTLAEGLPGEHLLDELLPCRPDADDFDDRLQARLKRHVVERCIYGVDLDALAVELCRISLWIETLDHSLPFTFLDHKIKPGNSLVGAWFDQFAHYPVMAWERATGDEKHPTAVHHEAKTWQRAISAKKVSNVKSDLVDFIDSPNSLYKGLIVRGNEVYEDARTTIDALHNLPIHDSAGRESYYNDHIRSSESLNGIRGAFNLWCALWFWPADQLHHAPMASDLAKPGADTKDVLARITAELRFFHWELEFPDVFRGGAYSGFDAIIGNPPWDTKKPNSMEFFSNLDPLYRSLGKQEANDRQRAIFAERPDIEESWLLYRDRFKSLSNYVKHVSNPFGDPDKDADRSCSLARGRSGLSLHSDWREMRSSSRGFSDRRHPYCHQGASDLNYYKMFLELGHALLRGDGYMGLIVPSGVYTDKGTTALRTLFIDHCRWQWLFGFENRDKIFDIHRSQKFCPIIVQKGGRTESIRAAFMRRSLADWEVDQPQYIAYPRDRVAQFSPKSRAILEISHPRDLEILEKIYSNSVLLGDDSEAGWGIKYATEFHMTNDSKLFPPRPKWEEKGYRPDEYSRWLLTDWKQRTADSPAPMSARRHELPEGIILSRDGKEWTSEDSIKDTALPLYEGRMIGQFDFSEKGWVSGKGRTAVWEEIGWEAKRVEPQYLMSCDAQLKRRLKDGSPKSRIGLKVGFMDVASATNKRTMIAALLRDAPCGNSAPVLYGSPSVPYLPGVLGSLVYDAVVRARCGGLHLNYFVIEESPLVPVNLVSPCLRAVVRALTWGDNRFAAEWLGEATTNSDICEAAVRARWALTKGERMRRTCMLNAIVALGFGLNFSDLSWILRDCDHPLGRMNGVPTQQLDPKGFWRIDQGSDPELRLPVLALTAFRDLEAIARVHDTYESAITAFCGQNEGEGWMLPEELRLSDLGLGHDERAKQLQPVRSRFGERFYPFQLAQSAEESWKECHLHARNLLGAQGYDQLISGKALESPKQSASAAEARPGYLPGCELI